MHGCLNFSLILLTFGVIDMYRALGCYFFVYVRTAVSVRNVHFKRMAEGTCVSKPPTEEQLKLLVEVSIFIQIAFAVYILLS